MGLAASTTAACSIFLLAGCSTPSAQPAAETGTITDVTAASVFSPDVCTPKDPAAVADIPTTVAGFTGYESEPGDWLTLPETSALTGKRVAVSVMGLGQPFFLAVSEHWKALGEKYKFEVKIYDGKFDSGTVQQLVDDIVADKPDAVAFAPQDSDASVPQVQKFIDAGIPVVTYNVQPRVVAAPRVFADDYTGSQIVGCNAGAYFAAKFPDRAANIGIVDLPKLPQVEDRKNGFLTGFLSQIPTAKVVQAVDGGGVIDKANPAASDLIQGNPDINVIFGINDDSSLGTVAALKTANKYSADWGVLAAVDGSRPALESMKDPASPYKAESGYPPRDFAYAAFNLLSAAVEGKAKPDTQVVVGYPAINPSDDGITKWLTEQYPN
ncbi:sugar ABC transporter substrate-binding protein [Glaciibacter psychrotolerans]|uniref:Ribose transport system substrate-binding protein n=1 Tax=Glaciibacter psychrotolerans TaxID=670054 RepID=A0A7Z0EH99_9MICO|nr:sugar ABC transporter substrate-binding protein [Leifsonia psychrotolerans]NYJ21656.1 ribose transport system substrate-binding protein [Leifsonia psychrotolerans]